MADGKKTEAERRKPENNPRMTQTIANHSTENRKLNTENK